MLSLDSFKIWVPERLVRRIDHEEVIVGLNGYLVFNNDELRFILIYDMFTIERHWIYKSFFYYISI